VRTCIGCRLRAVAGELLRLVVVDGDLVLDSRRRVAGRGAWLHPDLDCLAKAERRQAFARALRVAGPLDTGAVRAQMEQRAHGRTDVGVSGVRQEDRKQVDPS
jgi:predicted RNA-binding protein YlxR (DUF448 family)